MRPPFRSLHARMLALSLAATAVALIVAGWTIGGVLERFVTAGLDQRLDSEVTLLADAIDANGRVDRDRIQRRLGSLEAGPGWRWRISGPDGTIGSADFPTLDHGPPHPPRDPEGAGPPGPETGPVPDDRIAPLDGADEGGLRVHARRLSIATRRGPVELTAAAPRSVVGRPIRGALVPLFAILSTLAALLAGATLVQLRIGLRPLRALRDQVAAIRNGSRTSVEEDQPDELRPLATELNALARDNAAALATARLSAANLAHALKTPVATLALDVRDEPARAAQVTRIDKTIRHHLARARQGTGDRRVSTALAPAIADLVAAVMRLHADKRLTIACDVGDDLRVAVDPQDLDEMIGNLLDNAARHATGHIRIAATRASGDERATIIEVGDDGPGIPASERSRVIQAGVRLDERGDGHGFGLSVVDEVAALYGGRLEVGDDRLGGLLARLVLR